MNEKICCNIMSANFNDFKFLYNSRVPHKIYGWFIRKKTLTVNRTSKIFKNLNFVNKYIKKNILNEQSRLLISLLPSI